MFTIVTVTVHLPEVLKHKAERSEHVTKSEPARSVETCSGVQIQRTSKANGGSFQEELKVTAST